MDRSQWWLRNLCCSLFSHQQHSYPGWINPLTAFFAWGCLMWFQELQTQEASKLLEVEKAETPPSWESRVAVGQLGSALNYQRYTHTQSFSSPSPCNTLGASFLGVGGRVQWALGAQWHSLPACWRTATGRNDSDTCALALLQGVFLWHHGPCSLCCTNEPICEKVEKEKVAAKPQGAGSCCHVCVHETLFSSGVLGMYVSCGFCCWELVPNVAKPGGLVAWWLWMGSACSEAASKEWTDNWSGKGWRKSSRVIMSTFPGQKVIPLCSTGHLWVQHLPLQQEVLGSAAWGANRWWHAPASIHHLFQIPRLAAAHRYSLKPRLSLWWLYKWKSSF